MTRLLSRCSSVLRRNVSHARARSWSRNGGGSFRRQSPGCASALRSTQIRNLSSASAPVRPGSITKLTITMWRGLSTFVFDAFACPNTSDVTIRVEVPQGMEVGRLGLRLRVIRGSVPFRVPKSAIAIGNDGAASHGFVEPSTRTRPAIHATLAAQLVSSDGSEGAWHEVDVDVPEAPPAVYVHPTLSSMLFEAL